MFRSQLKDSMEGDSSAQQGPSASTTPMGALEPPLDTLPQDRGVDSQTVSGGGPQLAREAAASEELTQSDTNSPSLDLP